jgi:ribosomal protein S18 acetylase RimI-like enzyme
MQDAESRIGIRSAGAADAPAVAEIWYQGWRDGHEGHVADELAAVRTYESFRSRAAERVNDTVVVLVDGVVAGFVVVVDDEIEQVYVVREHRGSGVAPRLLREGERLVSENGFEYAWLAVVAGNRRARRFYERSGWIDEGPFDYLAAGPDGTISVPSHRYVKHVTGRPDGTV